MCESPIVITFALNHCQCAQAEAGQARHIDNVALLSAAARLCAFFMRLFGKESFVGLILTRHSAAIVEWSIWVFFCLFASGSSLALISGRCSFDPRLHPLPGGARPIDRAYMHPPYVWGWVICGKMGPLSPDRCFATKHPCNEPAARAVRAAVTERHGANSTIQRLFAAQSTVHL